MRRIAILGHFGGNQEFLDGQTVKTKILYDELKNKTDWDIQRIDTYLKSKKPISLLMQTLLALLSKRDIIVLLSRNGMKTFFPMLSFFSKYCKVRVFHDVIGGNLGEYVLMFPKFKDYLRSFEINWVETDTLKQDLLKCGISNCEVIPNFKRLNIVSEEEITKDYSEPYKFCTFSRVMKEKGIEEAINAIENINNEKGKEICLLDIYGPVDDSYKEQFEKVMLSSSGAINYCGTVPYDKSVSVLKEYYALLFPTYWDGEGFPGTIIDAYSAGLPVIASDWNSNKEVVHSFATGYIFPSKNVETLQTGIERIISLNDDIFTMKKECTVAASKYQPEKYVEYIVKAIEEE